MHKMGEKWMRVFLVIVAIYLICDGAVHFFNIKLQSIVGIWPDSALSYATLLNSIYASFVFLVASLILVAQTNIKKYKSLILVSSIWALFHGILLIYLTFTQDFANNFINTPSLSVWMPFYSQYLLFEGFLSFLYALVTFLWIKND